MGMGFMEPPPKVTAMWTWPSTPLPTPSAGLVAGGHQTGGGLGVCGSSRTPRSPGSPAECSTRSPMQVLTLGGKGLKQCWWGEGVVSLWRPNGRIYSDSYYKPYPAQSCLLDFGVSELSPFSTRRSKRPGVQLPVLEPVCSVGRGAHKGPTHGGLWA